MNSLVFEIFISIACICNAFSIVLIVRAIKEIKRALRINLGDISFAEDLKRVLRFHNLLGND